MAGLLAVLVVAGGCASSSGSSPRRPVPAEPSTPRASVRHQSGHWLCLDRAPRTPADFRLALNHHDERWQGGDGAVPVPLPDGRVAWLFGDTVAGSITERGTLVPGRWHLVHGTVLLQRGGCFDPLASSPHAPLTDLVPGRTARDVYWPGAGWTDPSGRRLYVMLDHVKAKRGAFTGFGFTSTGNALAELSLPDLRLRSVHAIAPPPIRSAPTWTAKPLRSGGWVYLYARHRFDHYVVRFRDRPDAWTSAKGRRYWSGTRWSSHAADLRPMRFDEPPISGLAVIRSGGRFLAVGMDGDDVAGWSAPAPAGPWKPIGILAETGRRGGRRYGGIAVTDLPGTDPFVIWNVAPDRSNSIAGSGIGAAAPLLAID